MKNRFFFYALAICLAQITLFSCSKKDVNSNVTPTNIVASKVSNIQLREAVKFSYAGTDSVVWKVSPTTGVWKSQLGKDVYFNFRIPGKYLVIAKTAAGADSVALIVGSGNSADTTLPGGGRPIDSTYYGGGGHDSTYFPPTDTSVCNTYNDIQLPVLSDTWLTNEQYPDSMGMQPVKNIVLHTVATLSNGCQGYYTTQINDSIANTHYVVVLGWEKSCPNVVCTQVASTVTVNTTVFNAAKGMHTFYFLRYGKLVLTKTIVVN